MKKSILVLLCLSLLAAVLSGCAAGNANTMGATDAPVVTFTPTTATTAPMNTMAPTTTMTPADDQIMGGATNNDMTGNVNGGAAGGMNGANAASSSMSAADAGRLAERIAEAIERISEIDDAEVIVHNGRALVAVEFDDQYSAGLDDRMKQLITDTVQQIDDSLTEVEITDDSTLYGQVKSLAERVGNATGLDELADDIGDLWDRITGR